MYKRQIAVFVAILGSGVPELAGFRAAWAFMAVSALAAGAALALLPAPAGARGAQGLTAAARLPSRG